MNIEDYLIEGENLENKFDLENEYGSSIDVYVSNKRLFVKEGNNIRDVNYDHISSIQFGNENYFWALVLGGISLLMTIGLYTEIARIITGEIVLVLIIVEISLIIIGITQKSEFLEITIIGLSKPLIFTGNMTGLDSLFRTVRKKR